MSRPYALQMTVACHATTVAARSLSFPRFDVGFKARIRAPWTSARRLQAGALEREIPTQANALLSPSWGSAMELAEKPDDKSNSIPLTRCRELLGEEADSLTDQEVASIRRHAETMAWILVEMYADGCTLPE